MAQPDTVTRITDAFAQATLGDGAVATQILLPNNMRPRADITSLTTVFEVVWYKAHQSLWFRYTTKDEAEAVHQALNGKQLLGIRIRCVLLESDTDQRYPYCVHLPGIPQHIGLAELSRYLPGGQPPDSMSEGPFSYPVNVDALQHICDNVAARANEPVRDTKLIDTRNGMKQKAEITLFAEAANLAAHANALDGMVIPEIGDGKVYVAERLHLYVAVDSEVYKRRSKTLKGIADRARDTHRIEVKIFDGELRYVQNTFLISVKGNGRAAVQQIKAEIDKCIGKDATKGLERRENKSVRKRRIYLNTVSEYRKANQEGGLERLKEFYGKDTVSFDNEHDPPYVTITTSDGSLHKAKQVLFREEPAEGSNVGECPICNEESVELIAVPDCGHSSCEACLKDFCITDTSAHLPLTCFTALGCEAVLPIRWLEEHLSPVAFRTLFENVIAAHCQQDVDDFVCCAGPDCDQYLATSTGVNKVVCPTCLTVNCTTCKTEYHYSETCEESARRRDTHDQALHEYLERVGGKLCPRCGTPGVRTEGCFHIECPGCMTHYCWLCLEWSNNMGEIYAHMEDQHGGAFGGQVQQRGRLVFIERADQREMVENAIRLMNERDHLQMLVDEQRAARQRHAHGPPHE